MAAAGDPVPAQRPVLDPRHAHAQRLAAEARNSEPLRRLTDLAVRLLSQPGAPVAVQVSLLTDVQTIAAGSGLREGAIGSTSPLADSLCTVTAASGAPLVVETAQADTRVALLPPVTSGQVAAYLGVPLTGEGGALVGAMCAFGPTPRQWSTYDVALLEELAGAVMAQLELQALSADFQANRLRWDVAIDAAGIGSFDWDLRTGSVTWDERMQALFGYAPGEFRQELGDAFSRVAADDRPALDAAIDAAIATCGDFRAEYRVRVPSGEVRWISARGRAVAGEDGTAANLVGTAHDITELRTARDDAARLLETMATGFLSVDRKWRVVYVNRTAERVVGLTLDELVGRNLWEAFPGLEDIEFGRQYKDAMATGETREIEAYYPHLQGWFEARVVPDPQGLSLYFLDVTARREDQLRAEAATQRLELLATVSAELAQAGFEIERAVARLGELVVPLLADWCLVSLIDGDRIRDIGYWHHDPAKQPLVETYVAHRLVDREDLGAVERVRASGRPVVLETGLHDAVARTLGSPVARQAWRDLAPESLVAVPLYAREQLVGILSLVRDADRSPMTAEEVVTVREVAARAGLALENARLYAAQRSLAEGLQRSLLTTPPEPDHCEIVVRYAPAAEAASVGGDWFDSFLQRDGATVVVIGDVMGHDTVAAAAMGQVRGLLRGIAWYSGAAPAEVLSGLDAAMQGLQVTTTATAVVARLEQSLDERDRGITRLRWSNAGHPPPMVLNPDRSVIVLADVESDLLLGFDPDTPRHEAAIVVDRGATVLLYTDGLVERRGQDLEAGIELLREALAELADLPLGELCDALLARLLPERADDDVAMVAVRLHRQDRPRPAEAGPQRTPPRVPEEPEP